MRKLRVAIIHNTIAPYRHPLFEELSKKTNLMVYYCSVKYRSREWALWPKSYRYKYKILRALSVRTSSGEFSLNPSIIKEITVAPPQAIVINGYTDPTVWIVFIISKLLKIPQVYWTE